MAKKAPNMSYEAYLDEVTTLITEKFDISDDDAIRLVMRAQAAEFFVAHDDDASLRTLDRAHEDARTLFKRKDSFP
jgi:hypothetical protein